LTEQLAKRACKVQRARLVLEVNMEKWAFKVSWDQKVCVVKLEILVHLEQQEPPVQQVRLVKALLVQRELLVQLAQKVHEGQQVQLYRSTVNLGFLTIIVQKV